jgi:putative heme-binding domain-containing protein
MSRAFAVCALFFLPLVGRASPENWAHLGLPVTSGLELWLDAGRLAEACRAQGLPAPRAGEAVDTWFDASGHARHLVQKLAAARPIFQDGGVRFEGNSAHLSLAGLGQSFRDLTVVLVATPFNNPGGFRAFLALNEEGKNDYITGLNVDLGPTSSQRFAALNLEGAGSGGAVNLLHDATDFGGLRRIALVTTSGPAGTRLWVDGKFQGRRDRGESTVRMDRITLGARCYNNEGGAARVRDFLCGEIREVLVYGRALSDNERAAVEKYLVGRYGESRKVPLPTRLIGGKPLFSVADPPPAQMFVPGFSVRELLVDLPNINNVRYRPDGKLMALGYNGNIYLLSDKKGHGVEDNVEVFWENKGQLRAPIGMALTPPGYKHGDGVFVACKGKLSLIVDTDGDGKADREIVVAQGWKELPHNVDALGVAVGPDGSLYFGLGTADFTNAYLIDRDGKAHYDLKGERGTVMKVSPDFSKREIVATGVRFSVGLAFNRHGDLFATDQEGATWLANGNPLDELLHIQQGRHYGFPPRHPRHLPDVVDEPSVYDYGPQHQSTCGMVFNEAVNNGPVFGPQAWAGDALVTGYSRGKLYRTQLVRTAGSYVARNHILGCLNMLAVDCCVSPRGELVVATHSGPPDWGSGPTGKGKLYKITYSDLQIPQPVAAWPSGPREVRVAFDRPLEPQHLRDLSRRVSIEYGRHVRAGDRFESLRPGYEVVQRQLAEPRRELPVLAAGVTPDRRTLILATGEHTEVAHYALTLAGLRPASGRGELPQHPAIDLDYDLSGVEASWQSQDGGEGWSGWLPHLDLAVSRAFTAGSAEHEKLWPLLSRPGRLTLRTQLDLWHLLRPAVQPGSAIDYTLPDEEARLSFTARLLELKSRGLREGNQIKVTPKKGNLLPLDVVVATGAEPALAVTWSTKEDARPRALPLSRLFLPWARTVARPEALVERIIPALQGGSWTRGREVFFTTQAQCSNCHKVRGRGGEIGPDLSNLVHRDYESVLRDVREPSAAINPDYIASLVELRDGRVLSGTVRSAGEQLLIGDATGRTTTVPGRLVESITPSAVSAMPVGLDKVLGPEKLRDLLTFLLTEPLVPAALECEGAPAPRRRAEVEAMLRGAPATAREPRKLHVVLAAGPKDHGPGEHDYPLWQRRWFNLLSLADGVTVSTAAGWPSPTQFARADVIVFYSNNGAWVADRARDLDAFLARGGGLVYIHYAVDGRRDVEALADRIGLAWRGGASRFRHGPLQLDFTASKHPIARNLGKLALVDESYWNLAGDPKAVDLLASGVEEGSARPLVWTRTLEKGRVFVSIPGHYTWSFDDPLFRLLLLRGIAWTAGEPVDRFNDLATVGARVDDP